eukprot:GHVR01072123.1.p1 GENE.GHVR01072123.1~~GHVR01072123.1.p1  ORF type:complete len:176 (+),score=31.97 GHVR01072123.1:438-965(+)
MSEQKNAALTVAKMADKTDDGIVTLSTGVRARLVPVATGVLEAVKSQIVDPPVPMWMNPEKEREEPNFNDPEYNRALTDNTDRRGTAVMDALIIFGVELVDGIPDSAGWLSGLKMMERLGHLDLSAFDLDDPLDLEFLYKKHKAVAAADYGLLTNLAGLTGEVIAEAEDTFPGDS